MPELPEVEHFRQLLVPLCDCSSRGGVWGVHFPSPSPPRKFPAAEEWEELCHHGRLLQVLRKGKVLCLVFGNSGVDKGAAVAWRYLYLHMGMTGRISCPERPLLQLESSRKRTTEDTPAVNDSDDKESFPPPHTHVVLQCDNYRVAFSDPRRFGSALIADDHVEDSWTSLAPDALDPHDDQRQFLSRLCAHKQRHKKPIKARLLDQRDVVSGVGNWVADEVLYHAHIHPMQTHLTPEEGLRLRSSLSQVLRVAIHCLETNADYPTDDWIFSHRWTAPKKRKKTKSEDSDADDKIITDSKGRQIVFEKLAGRTTLFVPSVQINISRTEPQEDKASTAEASTADTTVSVDSTAASQTKTPRRSARKRSASASKNLSNSSSPTQQERPPVDADDFNPLLQSGKRRQK